MRLLDLTSEMDAAGDVRGWMPITPAIRAADGTVRVAAIAMLMDALGGLRSITASAPDWALTADLSISLTAVPTSERVQADLHVRRRGRRTLVIEVDLSDDGGPPIGNGLMTFSVVPRPESVADVTIDSSPGRRSMSQLADTEPACVDYVGELGFVDLDHGVLQLALRPEVTNTVRALHGAVHTAMIDEATASLARHLMGGEVVVTDVQLAFMRLAHEGPITATARAIGAAHDGRLTARVELRDAAGTVCSMATTTAVAS